jgi:hypothetical protein
MRRSPAFVIVALACMAGAACSTLLDLQAPPIPDDGGTSDATMSGDDGGDGGREGASGDGPSGDASPDVVMCLGLDASPPPDAASDARYYALKNGPTSDGGPGTWTFFEPSTVDTNARNFQGGTFDGRYVYFAPDSNGTVTRYDTQGSFIGNAAWTTFDTTTLSPAAQGFSGAVYDGQYVYFVPYHSVATGYEGLVVRYDTHGAFAGGGPAWTVFDTNTLPVPNGGPTLAGFNGGVFDGRAVYLAPYFDGTRQSGVARYAIEGGTVPEAGATTDAGDSGTHDGGDAGAAEAGPPEFGTASQWSWFDMSTLNDNAAGYLGGAFDGRYLYLVPYTNNAGASGVVARYDTDASFVSNGAWSFFDTSGIDTSSVGFIGAAFDGRYLYLVPHSKTIVTRYDTLAGSIDKTSAWSTFDVSQIVYVDGGTASFSGAAFDGRFVYLVPSTAAGQSFGVVARYDTWSTFEATCAWTAYDISELNAAAIGYYGAIYDGQYLYFAPKGTVVARFDTKTPGAMPTLPAFNGSFY